MQAYSMYMDKKTILLQSILVKLIYKFNIISIEISVGFGCVKKF